MAKTVYLTTPLKKEDVEALEIDDVVYLSGELYTMIYYDHFTDILDMVDAGQTPPMNMEGGVMYHTGTIFRRLGNGEYDFRGISTTTSSKFNAFVPDFIRKIGIRAVMGKGGMDKNCLDAMRECGCVYLALAGGCSAIYKEKVIRIEEEYWPERHKSWADNMLRISVENYGPMFVAMDAHGHSIYQGTGGADDMNRQRIYEKLCIK